MKKISSILISVLLAAVMLVPMHALAAEQDIGNNLALNVNNWCDPGADPFTPSNASVTFDEEGIRFENMTNNNAAYTYYRGENVGEFDLVMKVDAHLNVPPEDSGAEWRYSSLMVSFLIDKTFTDGEEPKSYMAIPWQTNKTYMALMAGLEAKGEPMIKFVKYDAYAGDCMSPQYVGTPYSYNIVDGKEHELKLSVRNFDEMEDGERVTGKDMVCYADGNKTATHRYYDGEVQFRGKTYDVNISGIKGGIGFWCNSDWPGGTSIKKMKNWLVMKDVNIISYDKNPEGEYAPQLSEPDFEIKSLDYVTQASYETNFPIEIKLSDLFAYPGTKEVTYTATCEGQPVGEVKNGYFIFTPTEAKNYDIDITAAVNETNKAVNYLTLRVVAGETVNPETPETPAEEEKKGGCGSVVFGGALVGSLALIGIAAVSFKKRG